MPKWLFLIGLLLCPLSVSAVERIELNFEGNTPGNWEVKNLTNASPSPQGLVIKTDRDGRMTTSSNFIESVETVSITVKTYQTMEALLLWKDPEYAADGYIQLPFIMYGSPDAQTIDIDLSSFDFWHSKATEFGIAFPAGAEIILKDITFSNWNAFEKATNVFKGFWTFDTYRSHSINFLWGPWLTFNPIARANIYTRNPPVGNSAMWIFYGILAIGGIWFLWKNHTGGKNKLAGFLILFAILWLVNDLRMGSELISYVKNDWNNYVSKGIGERTFRSNLSFPDAVDESLAYIANDPYYIFFGPTDTTVYFSIMRYLTYPNLPINGGDKMNQVKHAITFGRNSEIDDEGNLIVDDQIVRVGSGSLLKRINKFGSIFQFKE
ncbi:MAG: hypothetical protein K9M03_02360 [Kiritimatiellales bacterium]|nr:hypothetical protein [Kiritimatiellales bacterium]